MKKMYWGFLDGYNNKLHRGGEIIGTIVPQNSRFGLTNGYKVIEVVYEQQETDKTPKR